MNNIYITAGDVAENAKLNHKITEELRKYKRCHPDVEQSETEGSSQNKKALFHWILRAKALRMTCLLGTLFLLPTLTQAETCTPTPDCKSLGYTETSCPDGGGVKCPWNTNLWHCDSGEKEYPCLNCHEGWILNSDMTCSSEKINGKTPIGVVVLNRTITIDDDVIKCQAMAVALNDIGKMDVSKAELQCKSYSASGVSGWHLPTKEELLIVHDNISSEQGSLTKAGGTQFSSDYYWSSSYHSDAGYGWYNYIVNPVSGDTDYSISFYDKPSVRPVLAFRNEFPLP